ncbi:MAG: Ig-like domain-containing protein, partial [Acidimicrobiia bacterium]
MKRRYLAGRLPRVAAHLRRGDTRGGFTLVELMAAVSIMAIVALPLTLAITLGYRTVFGIEQKLGSSGDAQTISAYFPADVQSVDAGNPATSTPDGVNPADPVNVNVCPPTLAQQSLLTLVWDQDLGQDGQSVARYVSSGKGSDSKLTRLFCKGSAAAPVETVLARNFGSGDPETGPDAATFLVDKPTPNPATWVQTPSCTGDACSIKVNGDYRFALSVNRRVPGITGTQTTPGKPTNVHGIGGNQRVTLYWTDPSDGGSPITGYAIETTPGNVVSGPYPPGSGAGGVVLNGLTNLQSYTFRVRAINAVGNGPYSDPSPPVTPGPTVPDPPTTGTATADPAVNGRASLTWSLPSGYNDGGSPLNSFRVYAQNTPSPPITADVLNPAATGGTVDGLLDNTKYQLQVTASNASGESALSTLSNTILTLPGKPAISTAQSTSTPGQIKVTFAVPPGGNFSDLTNFRLHVLDTNTFTTPVAAATACPGANPTTCTLTVNGLTLGQNYSITVQAQNATGWGPESDPAINIDITPPQVTITSPTTGTASNNSQPAFTGTAGTDSNDLPGIVVKIYSGPTATGSPVRSFATTSSAGAWSTLASQVSPALPDGQYTAQAEQTDTGGNVGGSNTVTFVVDGVAPTVNMVFPVAAGSYNLAGWAGGCTPAGICGTASDAGAGSVASVAVTVQRAADGLYWNGTTWVAGPVFAPVTGTTTWKVGLPAASLNNGSYTATAQATDAAGNASGVVTHTFTTDTSAPTVTVEQASGQADPTNGSPINYTVTFSEPVTGFTAADLSFTGSTAGGAKAGAITGAGPTYNVAVTGMTGTGTVVLSIPANGVTDLAGNNNTASTSTDNVVSFDNVAPTVTVNQAAGQADPTNALPINYTVTFSEAVTGFDNTDLTPAGTAPGTRSFVVTGGPTTYNVAVSGLTGSGTSTVTVAANRAQDLVGNNNTASTSTDNSVTYDVTSPTVTINQGASQADPTKTSPVVFTVTFSEAVAGFTSADVSFTGSTAPGTLAAAVSGAGPTYTVNVTGMTGSGNIVASIPAGVVTDAAGNPNAASTSTDNTVTYDVTPPTVTVNQAVGQNDPVNAGPINFTVTFSEPVTGFTAPGDLTIGGTAGGTKTGTITGGPTVYNVAVNGMTGNGTVTLSVPAAAAADLAGNNSAASTSTDNSVTLDTTPPPVTVNQAAGQEDPTNALPINYTVTFSEAVTGFDNTDLTSGGTAPGTRSYVVTGGPATYNVAVSGLTGSGTSTLTVAASRAQDLAGNNNSASTSTDNSVTYDATAPTVTINQAAGQADPTNGSPIAFTATFSETVAGFTGADVSFTGSTAPGTLVAAVSGAGPTYTVNVSGMTGSGTVVASIPAGGVTDTAGNANVASTSTDNTVTFDNV